MLNRIIKLAVTSAILCSFLSADAHAQGLKANEKLRADTLDRVRSARKPDGTMEVIVEIQDTSSRQQAKRRLTAQELSDSKSRYDNAKGRIRTRRRFRTLRDFSHLPLMLVTIDSEAELERLISDPDVAAVHDNEILTFPTLQQSLPAIRQNLIRQLTPFQGDGTTIAIMDTGVDFTEPEFGSCTAAASGWQPQSSPSCRITHSLDFGDADGQADDNGHGTNVSAIAASVAPRANIVVLDVFRLSGGRHTASNADKIAALNWVRSNAATLNIVAVNMSLGSIRDLDNDNTAAAIGDVDGDGIGDIGYTSLTCPTTLNTAFSQIMNAGVVPVVASGNDGLRDTIGYPACDGRALAVGATHVENLAGNAVDNDVLIVPLPLMNPQPATNGYGVGQCTRATPQNQAVTCFSNSSSLVNLVAPGTAITAGGWTMTGTSMAAPHVAGLVSMVAQVTGDQLTGTDLWQSMLAGTSTRHDPKFGDIPYADAVELAFGNSRWTSPVYSLPAAAWYKQGLPEALALSILGYAHQLYGNNTNAANSRSPLNNRAMAPLVITAVRSLL